MEKSRRVAILVDGGFYLKRLPKLVSAEDCSDPGRVVEHLQQACKNHVENLYRRNNREWIGHVYRIFFYDAEPYSGRGHHPLENIQIDFSSSPLAEFRRALFDKLRRQRKVALRLGKVTREGDWSPPTDKVRKILKTRDLLENIDLDNANDQGDIVIPANQVEEAKRLKARWLGIQNHEVRLGFRQKGVDMRIGLDIASITLKKQADAIILISGDSDFVPAAKLARREGIEFILDPMWQNVNEDLYEHIDGLHSGFQRPSRNPSQ